MPPPYSALANALPADVNGRRFVGPAGKVFHGIQHPSIPDEAMAGVVLLNSSGTPLLTVDAFGLDVDVVRLPISGIYAGALAHDVGGGSDNIHIFNGLPQLRLVGLSAVEMTAVNPAAFNLRNGSLVSSPVVYTGALSANGSRDAWFGPEGINIANGLYLQRTSGQSYIVVYYKNL